jgi:hypothetical protein
MKYKEMTCRFALQKNNYQLNHIVTNTPGDAATTSIARVQALGMFPAA